MDVVQFHDRSAVCTAALAAFLGYPASEALSHELQRIEREGIYQRRVFFIRTMGFIRPTEARRISFEEAQRFERIHQKTYREHGFGGRPHRTGKRARPGRSDQTRTLAA